MKRFTFAVMTSLLATIVAIAISPTPTPKTTDGMYLYHQDFGQWLDVVWSGATTEERWHPNWTSIVTNYKPVVHKLPHGRYEITFTSDIMKDLP